MSEHIITREMLIATLSEVMKERDHAKRELEVVERTNADARARLNEELRVAKKNACTCNAGPGDYAMVRRQDESLDQPPEQRIQNLLSKQRKLAQILSSLQTNLVEVTKQRDAAIDGANANASTAATALEQLATLKQLTTDEMLNLRDEKWKLREEIERLKRDNMLLTVKLTPPFDIRTNAPRVDVNSKGLAGAENDRLVELTVARQTIVDQDKAIVALQAESDKNAKAAQMAEQEVRVARSEIAMLNIRVETQHKAQVAHDKERLELMQKQCQCVPVLEEKIKKLEAQLPEKMKNCTIRFNHHLAWWYEDDRGCQAR